MDRFRKSHLVALALALIVIASTSSALAAGRRPTNRGIESGGTPEQEVTGEPDTPGGSGLPRELSEYLRVVRLVVLTHQFVHPSVWPLPGDILWSSRPSSAISKGGREE